MADPDEIMTELVIKQAASLVALGTSQREVATQLNISRSRLRDTMTTPAFALLLKEIGDTAITQAKQAIRARTAKLGDKALKALEKALDKNELEAVKLVFKAVGVLDQPEQQTGDTNINVILPGQKVEQAVEPTFTHIGDSDDSG